MSPEQIQLPGMLCPVNRLPVPVRFKSLEITMLAGLSGMSGLSRSELIRRCVRYAMAHEDEFLGVADRPALRRHSTGRKPKAAKMRELEKQIAASRRQLERDQAALAELRGKRARAA